MFWVFTALFADLVLTFDPLGQIAQMKKLGADLVCVPNEQVMKLFDAMDPKAAEAEAPGSSTGDVGPDGDPLRFYPFPFDTRYYVGAIIKLGNWWMRIEESAPTGIRLRVLGSALRAHRYEPGSKPKGVVHMRAKDYLCQSCVIAGDPNPGVPGPDGFCDRHRP